MFSVLALDDNGDIIPQAFEYIAVLGAMAYQYIGLAN